MKIQEVVYLFESGINKFIGSSNTKRTVVNSNWAWTQYKVRSRPNTINIVLTRDFAKWAKTIEEDKP